jgi:hypothetical protein
MLGERSFWDALAGIRRPYDDDDEDDDEDDEAADDPDEGEEGSYSGGQLTPDAIDRVYGLAPETDTQEQEDDDL